MRVFGGRVDFTARICYKETDENGKRTPDSVLAQELYYGLEREGFKVFFSRITLESKLGTEYEPYIFAALNSAKVMVVVGTKPEYFNAVWVRNEWSRYLMLMQEDRSRTLIPAYKDMDPYDLPDALSMFQAQDMSKLGFMQDLLHGISKIAKDEPRKAEVKETVIKTNSANIENLIKRGALALEDGDWSNANKFYEQILDEDVEEYRAYLGKLCAELKINFEKDLVNANRDFSGSDNYRKAIRFADDAAKKIIEEYNMQSMYNQAMEAFERSESSEDYIRTKELFDRTPDYADCLQKSQECRDNSNEITYQLAERQYESAETDNDFKSAADIYGLLDNYKDSSQKYEKCIENANEYVYLLAKEKMESTDEIPALEHAISLYTTIYNYKDSSELIARLGTRIDEIKEEQRCKIIYDNAVRAAKNNNVEGLQRALKELERIPTYSDSIALTDKIRERIDLMNSIENEGQTLRKRRKEISVQIADLGFFSGARKKTLEQEYNNLGKKLEELHRQELFIKNNSVV